MKKTIFLFIGIFLFGSLYIVGKDKLQNEEKTLVLSSTMNTECSQLDNCKSEEDESDLFFNKPENILQKASVKIYKSKRRLELYDGEELVGRFKIALGGSPIGHKYKEGDKRTPEGKYYICTRNTKTKFTLFMGISYPNKEDAENALNKGIINKDTFEKIEKANENRVVPKWNTPLGGEVGIHGGGNERDWTWGCIALNEDDIRIIWKYTKIGTPVEIFK